MTAENRGIVPLQTRLLGRRSTPIGPHPGGIVLPDRGDGLHWLRCHVCGKEWAEKDSGAFAKGERNCS